MFDQPSPEPKGPTTLLGVNSANPPLDHKQKDTYYKGNITGPGSDFIKLSDGIYPNLDFRRVSLSGITAALLYKEITRTPANNYRLVYTSNVTAGFDDTTNYVRLNENISFIELSLSGSSLAAVNADNELMYTDDPSKDLVDVVGSPGDLAQVSLSGTSALVLTTGNSLQYESEITGGSWANIAGPTGDPTLVDISMSGKAAAVLDDAGTLWYTSDVSVASPSWTQVTLPTLSDTTQQFVFLSLFEGEIAMTTNLPITDGLNIWYAPDIEAASPAWENPGGWLSDVSISR